MWFQKGELTGAVLYSDDWHFESLQLSEPRPKQQDRDRKISDISRKGYFCPVGENISIFHGCMVWTEKSVMRVTDWHREACRVMPNSDPE